MILEALGATRRAQALLQRLLKSDQKFCLAFLLSKTRSLATEGGFYLEGIDAFVISSNRKTSLIFLSLKFEIVIF